MKIEITGKAKEKLQLMKENNVPIALTKYPVGCSGFKYRIVSMKPSESDKVYNVDGFDIIVTEDCEIELKGAKIDYGGLIRDFIVSPRF